MSISTQRRTRVPQSLIASGYIVRKRHRRRPKDHHKERRLFMTDERRARIESAIGEQEARGVRWTNKTIYAEVRGSYPEVNRYLRDRRAQAQDSSVPAPEPHPGAVAEEPEPVVVAPRPPATGTGALAARRQRYHALAQAAFGTAPGSYERQELARYDDECAQKVQAARECLARARRLRPQVAYEQAHAATAATGTPNATAYAAQLAHGMTSQAALYRSALAVLTQFVGPAEATRLVGNGEQPQWALHTL